MSTDFAYGANLEFCSNEVEEILNKNDVPEHTNEHLEPMNLSISTLKDSSLVCPLQTRNFLNPPKNSFFQNVPISVPNILPHLSNESITKNHSIFMPQDTKISIPEDLSKPSQIIPASSSHHTVNIGTPELFIEDSSKSRVAIRFLLKKSKRFCGAIRFYLTPDVANSSKIKNLMTNLKDSVMMKMPTCKTFSQFIDNLVSTAKGQRLPDCLRFLGLSLTSKGSKRKRNKNNEKKHNSDRSEFKTFLNPVRKPEQPQLAGGFSFSKPKVYECSYCDTRFYKMPVYLKHIRRHVQIIRCDTCSKSFSSIINKRRHQLQCHQRAIL